MRTAVFGLGYVGLVAAAALARDGHAVIGVDPNPDKRALVGAGRSPIVEPGVEPLIAAGVASGALRVSECAAEAVAASEMSLVCVGTPSRRNGSLDTDAWCGSAPRSAPACVRRWPPIPAGRGGIWW